MDTEDTTGSELVRAQNVILEADLRYEIYVIERDLFCFIDQV